jgi:hypothetical protein
MRVMTQVLATRPSAMAGLAEMAESTAGATQASSA